MELYYSEKINDNRIMIEGEELHHIRDVMRHKVEDLIYVTDGKGKIFFCRIESITKERLLCVILKLECFNNNRFPNIFFCIPRLKNNDRFEFAIEKSVELGITNFIFFESKRSVAKGFKVERIKKILLSAMKQSLNAWLPKDNYIKSIDELNNWEGKKILLEQKSNELFLDFITNKKSEILNENTYFIFGPEGGFAEEEIGKLNSVLKLRLTEKRLRSETAIITTASLLATLIQ